ncbi:DUF5131 family protein [Pseudonocardia oceani]|uniref:DUF5131 family protein n=1 Tax=Pseudonocardia oceani TaxID=2792013 RepID=UPI00226B3041|nr:DUF5131 family protein [Pseudonocardia oceani]
MSRSRIEWTEVTWNPTTGCDRVSAGCDHCYALTLAKRFKGMGSAKYQNDGAPAACWWARTTPESIPTVHPGPSCWSASRRSSSRTPDQVLSPDQRRCRL